MPKHLSNLKDVYKKTYEELKILAEKVIASQE